MWNKDEARGKMDQAKGRVKEKIGDLNQDEKLKNEGADDRAAGEVEEAFGKGRHKVGDALKDLGDRIKR